MADYVIRDGDWLSTIAQRFGTTVEELVRLNGIRDPNSIRAGVTIRVPDAPGAAAPQQGGKATAPVPYTGGPIRGAAASSSQVQAPGLQTKTPQAQPPLPPGNPVRTAGAPLPRPNPAAPNVPGPPLDRGAPMQAGGGPAGYQPAGWNPVPAPGPVPTTQQWTTRGRNPGPIGAPDGDPAMAEIYGQQPFAPPGNGVGIQTAPVERGDPLPAAGPARLPDFANMPQRELERYMSDWVATGRRLDQLPPEFQMVWNFRLQEMRDAVARDELAMQREREGFRNEWGTDPRLNQTQPFGPSPNIGEGEYLPQEMIQLGQLGANMAGAPRANTTLGALAGGSPPPGANVIGGQYLPPPQNAATLGQLATRPWPFAGPAPYYGV